jgi:N-acyl-D-aspartate/D-glutamate deacylase
MRRDQMLLGLPPGVQRQSWHNNGHDIASGVIYTSLIAAPLALAQRFGNDPQHASVRGAAIGTSAVTAGALGLFASRALEPYNGLVQRFAVTVPALASAALAMRLLRASSAA